MKPWDDLISRFILVAAITPRKVNLFGMGQKYADVLLTSEQIPRLKVLEQGNVK